MVKVSFIVPVYNAQDYIKECIESILMQTYDSLELILVDDGSKDNSLEICESFLFDKRVIVVHQENSGPSVARNKGLDLASGELIAFIDSDDFWRARDDLAYLMTVAEKLNYDFSYIEFNRSRYFPSTNSFLDLPLFPQSIVDSSDMRKSFPLLVECGRTPNSACTKLIKRDFLISNNIRFEEGRLDEDIIWYLDVLKSANKVYYDNRYVYGNRGEIATSRSSIFSVDRFLNLLEIIEKEENIIKNENDLEFKRAILSYMAYEYCILLGQINQYDSVTRCGLKVELKKKDYLLLYNLHPNVARIKKIYNFVGFNLTCKILFFYLRNKELIKKIKSRI